MIARLLNADHFPQLAYTYAQLNPERIRAFLRSAGVTLSQVTFDARVLLSRVSGPQWYHFDEYLERYLTAFATGELTEADFRAA